MAGEWRPTTIGELCDSGIAELATGPFGSQLHAHDYLDKGVAVVPTEAIRDRRIDHTVLPKISTAKAKELERHRLRRGDILFARRGVQATGHIGCVREAEDGFVCGTGAIRLRINERARNIAADFISHVLADPASVAWFKFHAIGATMPNLNEGIIRSFPFLLPPLAEQRAIAHILGALDDKIELNRRMNGTLEAMARALFKSWFVDFDLVHAKVESRKLGLSNNLLDDLFPNSLTDSAIGRIPKGWEVNALSDVLTELETGGRPKGGVSGYVSGIPSVGAESIVGLGIFDYLKTRYIPQEYFNGMAKGRVKSRDVLLYKDGGRPGQFEPHVTLFGDGFPFDTCAINEHVYRLRARDGFGQNLLFFWLSSPAVMEEMRVKGTGVAIPGLNSTQVKSLTTLVPSIAVAQAFDSMVEPCIARILASCNESRTLAALRDTLLPKLISGQLRVIDAERAAAQAM